MSKTSHLDKYFLQWGFLRNHILPYLIDRALKRNPESPRLVVADIGSSTGEEIARTFYEIITALEKRGEGENLQKWKIEIRGIEKNKGVAGKPGGGSPVFPVSIVDVAMKGIRSLKGRCTPILLWENCINILRNFRKV